MSITCRTRTTRSNPPPRRSCARGNRRRRRRRAWGPAAATPRGSNAAGRPAQPRRDLLRGQVRLDPGVGVRLPHVVGLVAVVVLVGLVSEDHARRNPLAAEHQRQRGGEILAIPPRIVPHEVLDRVQTRVARRRSKRILELVGGGEFLLQPPRAAEVIARGQTAFGEPFSRSSAVCGAWGNCKSEGKSRGQSSAILPMPGSLHGTSGAILPSSNAVVSNS